MKSLNLKANHKPVKDYYEVLNDLKTRNLSHEGAVSPAFASLLRHCGAQFGQTLIEKFPFKYGEHNLIIDGAMANGFNLIHGYWEAKDSGDDLDKEIKKKFAVGYPKNNILFQAPNRIVVFQNSKSVFDANITNPESLIEALKVYFEYEPPAYEEWGKAADEFKLKVKELAIVLLELIEKERKTNNKFVQAFDDFVQLCQETINPDISVQAVEEMLIQHLLTERIFRKVFNNPDFAERNVIAREVEKVILALTSHSFSRSEFLKPLDRFYVALETTAATIDDFSQKQSFLNTVYEKFFQGFSVKVADTHGIVYTPQPIVKFMVTSVEHILQTEFGRSLSDQGVHIIDPFVGTGNFILSIMHEIQRSKLPFKYDNELHCNEVMLLPYYIASMNIEHAYFEATDEYKPFEGICLVDTFETSKHQAPMFVRANTARVRRQQNSPIFVVIGNPPYNAKQVNENDNNKNRKYKIDDEIARTYVKDSKATNKNALSDPYVKAIYWASKRIGNEGIVALVTNNSFVNEISFDGMRKNLEKDFDSIYILDLGGNVRKNPKLSGTTNNVFGIQIGVSINLFIKTKCIAKQKPKIYYSRLDEFWKKEQKYEYLNEKTQVENVAWQELEPDEKHNWLTKGLDKEFEFFLALGDKKDKSGGDEKTIFKVFSNGVETNRDDWAYNFRSTALKSNINKLIETYNNEVERWRNNKEKSVSIDDFVLSDAKRIKWCSKLKASLLRYEKAEFSETKIRHSYYRPFCPQFLFYDKILTHRPAQFLRIFPEGYAESENVVISIKGIGIDRPFTTLMISLIPEYQFLPNGVNYPLYTYSEDGNNRTENITDWALTQIQTQYKDNSITKRDIFNYVYGLLHSPMYREKYAANLKRDLPHIPFVPDFWGFATAGKLLADLHVNYEKQPEYKLTWIEEETAKVHYRVDKMALTKDRTQIIYNDFLTLAGIPPEVFEYRLGNRSALEWIIDQYQISADKRSGITNDPNRTDDPQYIVRLIGKIITVSLETVKIVNKLPKIE